MDLFDLSSKDNPSHTQEPSRTSIEIYQPVKKAELCDHDKEVITVRRITLQDMEQFTALPFIWNSEIKKVIGPSTQPYAYMDIIGSNIGIASAELEKMNAFLLDAHRCTTLIPRITNIPIDNIIFEPTDKRGPSKIICTPYTFSGKVSKYPAALSFKTDLAVIDTDTTHGDLYYGRSGKVEKARICCWRKGKGYFFHYKTVHKELILSKIISTAIQNEKGMSATIYQSPIG